MRAHLNSNKSCCYVSRLKAAPRTWCDIINMQGAVRATETRCSDLVLGPKLVTAARYMTGWKHFKKGKGSRAAACRHAQTWERYKAGLSQHTCFMSFTIAAQNKPAWKARLSLHART